MSAKNKASMPGGGHKSVSNKPEESLSAEEAEFFTAESVSEDPSEGKAGKVSKASGGTEDVPGHKKTSGESIFTAPDTSMLRDIGEASFGVFPETVHLPDDRVQITNTAPYPWRVHASLRITAD